jgi:hypothetical protein
MFLGFMFRASHSTIVEGEGRWKWKKIGTENSWMIHMKKMSGTVRVSSDGLLLYSKPIPSLISD